VEGDNKICHYKMRFLQSILLVIMTIAALSSCTTTIYIQKKYAPEIQSKENPLTVVFINNFNYENPRIVLESQHVTYQKAVSEFTKGLLKGFLITDTIKLVIGDTLRNNTPAGMLTTLLPIVTITDACSEFNAGILISLDSVYIDFDSKFNYVMSANQIEIYANILYLFAEFFLTAYSPNGEMINRSSIDRSLIFGFGQELTDELLTDLSVADRISNVAEPCGEDYCKKFIPFNIIEARKVYSGAKFKESNELMKLGDWTKAVSKLEALSKSSNVSFAFKSMNNLNVAKEGAGK
jgi:hypothetical protein